MVLIEQQYPVLRPWFSLWLSPLSSLATFPSCQAPGQRPVCRDYASSCPALSMPARLIQSSCCFCQSLQSHFIHLWGPGSITKATWYMGKPLWLRERAGLYSASFLKTWTDEPEIGWQENGLGMFSSTWNVISLPECQLLNLTDHCFCYSFKAQLRLLCFFWEAINGPFLLVSLSTLKHL